MGDSVELRQYVGSSANVPNKGHHYSTLVNFCRVKIFYFIFIYYFIGRRPT